MLKRFIVVIMLVLFFVSSLTLEFRVRLSRAEAPARSIILFSWDGVERTVFRELYDAGQLPFVQSLPFVINMTDNVESGAATSTRPQHATMFSGYLAGTTGIWTNDPSQNPSGASLPQGYLVFERVKNYSAQIKVVGATAKANNVGDLLSFAPPPPGEVEVTYTNEHGFDTFVVHSRLIQDYPPLLVNTTVNVAGEICLNLAENIPPFFYSFHFSDPDRTGHMYGYNSIQYRDAIKACDNVTGRIFDKLASSSPAIIVTSDHGFGKPTVYAHSNTPSTFLATNLPLQYSEAREADVTPTIFGYLQIPIATFAPTLEGHSLMSTPGDVSGVVQGVPDGVVDTMDINYVMVRFGSKLGSLNWRPNADVNDDGKVNMRDVGIVCHNFGTT